MRFNSVRVLLITSVVIPVVCCSIVFAQQGTATLNGQVSDVSGLAIAGAKIEAVNTGTNVTYTATTNEAGLYNFPQLQAGTYQVTAAKEGFQQLVRPGVELHVSDAVGLNLSLQVGSVSQTVTVESGAPLVETTSSELGGLVSDTKIADLPLNGRNYIDLSLLQAGITQNSNTGSIAGMAGTTYSANGAPIISNNYLLDGTQVGNQSGWSTASFGGTTLGVDGIKEYKILTSAFDASYGMNMGSQMVMVSKGGTNQFHGDVFEYFRNSALNARNYFDAATKPNLIKNNFGVSFGGPIRKDKTFFFAVYEGLRQNLGYSAVDTVLAAGCHGKAGDVIWNGSGVQPAGSIGPCPQLGANPNLGLAAGASNNFVTIVNSQIASMMALYPNPTDPTTNQYRWGSGSTVGADYGQIRLDHTFSNSDTLFARYTIDRSANNSALANGSPVTSGVAFAQFRGGGTSRDQFVTLSETHIFSPSISNTARLSFARTGWLTFWIYGDQSAAPIPSFPGGPGFLAGQPFGTFGVSGLSSNGFGSIAGPPNVPAMHLQNIYTIADDVFLQRGKHQFRFGTLLNRFNEALTIALNGFEGQPTYTSVARFLQGVPTSFSAFLPGGDFNRFFIYNTYGFYGQDDWHVNSRLTLNLGLRWEFLSTLHELNNKSYAIRNTTTDTSWTMGPVMRNRSRANVSPRVGFAWDIFGDGKTALRGGGGVYYDIGQFGGVMTGNSYTALPNISLSIQNPTNKVFVFPVIVPTQQQALASNIALNEGQTFGYDATNPMLYQWNLTLQRQLPKSMAISIAYVGTRGVHEWEIREGNPVQPTSGLVSVGGVQVPYLSEVVNGQQYWSTTIANCQAGILDNASGTFLKPTCRVNPVFGTLGQNSTTGISTYDSLQVVVAKRLSKGLESQTAYTFGHSLTTTPGALAGVNCVSGMDSGVDFNTVKTDYGPACWDARHNVRFNLLYHFPTVKADGLLAKVVNGWWMGNIVGVESGLPFSPIVSGNRSQSANKGAGADRPDLGTATVAPGQVGPDGSVNTTNFTFVPYDPKTVVTGDPAQWFNPLMFTPTPIQPCPGTNASPAIMCSRLGTASRGMLRGPGLGNWDFSLVKDTQIPKLGESGSIQFRAEIFNILNRPNFGTPGPAQGTGPTVYTGAFTYNPATGVGTGLGAYSTAPVAGTGAVTWTTTTSRQIQFALKVVF